MALTLTKVPELYSLSGNPVIIEITTDTSSVVFHKLHVRTTSNGELKGEDILPVINGKAQFDISDYLKEELKGHFTIDKNIHEIDIAKDYQFSYFETYDNDGIEHDPADSSVYKVMQGKIDFLNILKLNKTSETFNSKFYEDNNALVLRQYDKRYVHKNENDILYFFKTGTSIYRDYKIEIFILLKDRSTINFSVDIPGAVQKIYNIPWGFNNLIKPHLMNPETIPLIYSYKLILNYGVSGGIEPITLFYGEYFLKTKEIQNTLVLKNSLGVYEIVNLYGTKEERNKYTREFAQKSNSDLILDGSHKKNFKINTGWISKNEYTNLLLLLKSKDSYTFENELNIPIVIVSTKTDKRKSNEYLYSLEIEIEYAHTDYF